MKTEYIVLGPCIFIILFFLCREIYCWYAKINESILLQKETNRLLRKIAGESEPEQKPKDK